VTHQPPPLDGDRSYLVLLSGGLDSTVLTTDLLVSGATVQAVSIHYGQRHERELIAAAAVAAHLQVPYSPIELLALGSHLTSSLTGAAPVPHGHYADANMSSTVVPNRNAIMLMVAAGIAAARGLDAVVTAVHAGDHPVYPDCRPEFVAAANTAALLGTGGQVEIHAPYARITKEQIVQRGARVVAPFALTWSCYQGGDTHCGRCGTCVERAEAFAAAGVQDPTTYLDPDFWRTATERQAAEVTS
jgi:7-cyano-7-deazaguanine synthase